MNMKIIDQKRLDRLSNEAAAAERRRQNLNLHDDYADPCQRLFNAMEPGTYVRPHRHLDPPKAECFMAIRGRMALIVFADDGQVDRIVPFGDGCETVAIDLPPAIGMRWFLWRPAVFSSKPSPGPTRHYQTRILPHGRLPKDPLRRKAIWRI